MLGNQGRKKKAGCGNVNAKEYLKYIRESKKLIKLVDEEIVESKAAIYNLPSLDAEEEKVSNTKKKDISKKLATTENIIRKNERKKMRLIELREEARERISVLPNPDAQDILTRYCILAQPLKKIKGDTKYSGSGFFKKLNRAIGVFESEYNDWLQDLQIFDKEYLR